MSWNLSVSKVTRTNAREEVEKATPNGQDDLVKERDEQVWAAKQAALELIETDALFSGDPGDIFNVNLYGHANPDHKAREGWANDTISVAVSRG